MLGFGINLSVKSLNLRRVFGKILDSSCYIVVVSSHHRPDLLGTDIQGHI